LLATTLLVIGGLVPIIVAFVGGPFFTLGWERRPKDVREMTSHGSARWAESNDIPDDYKPGGRSSEFAILGLLSAKGPKTADVEVGVRSHIVTCAPTGAGKGIGCAIPNLWTYRHSVVVLDLKGELVRHTAEVRRRMGQRVFVLDPFKETKGPYHVFNPMGRVTEGGPQAISEATQLADALVVRSSLGTDTYWDDAAADLLKGLILHVACEVPPAEAHLGTLRERLTDKSDDLKKTFKKMSESKDTAIRRCGQSMLQKHDKELSSVLSSARRHTDFLDDPCLEEVTRAAGISFSELKRTPTTIYLVLPPHQLIVYRRWVRLILAAALADMTRTSNDKVPVLFLLDEFPKLGRMTSIEDGISILRGYGVQLWIFVQDLSQLRVAYPGWRTFLANATLQCFGTQDMETARYVSQLLGNTTQKLTHVQHGTSHTSGLRSNRGTSQSSSEQRHSRALRDVDELRCMDPSDVIAFLPGCRPVQLRRLDARPKLQPI